MTTYRLLILGISASLAFVGCRRAPSDLPATGFRLIVQNVVTDGDMQGAQLAIISSANATIAVDTDLNHHNVALTESAAGRGSVTLMASRVAPSGQPWAYMQTLIRAQTASGGRGGGTAFEALPQQTELHGFFTVTAKAGDYAFDSPIVIGTLRGKPITLTLKRSKT